PCQGERASGADGAPERVARRPLPARWFVLVRGLESYPRLRARNPSPSREREEPPPTVPLSAPLRLCASAFPPSCSSGGGALHATARRARSRERGGWM